jgi:hypothetical protein
MSCTAAWNQKTFRGRNDDGNETTATWKAIQGADFAQLKDTNFRIRFEVQETAACSKNNVVWRLQYNRNAAGWVDVTATSSVVRSSASPNLADAANLTNQLTVGTGTFQGATGFDEVNGDAGGSSMDLAASGHAEAEYCVQIRSADVASGDTIQLRITDSGTAFAAYDDTPTITVDSGAVTVTPGLGALDLTGFAPTAQTPVTVTPGVGALDLTGFAPTVQTPTQVTPGTGALDLTGFAPTVQTPVTVTPGVGTLDLTGFAPTVQTPVTVTPGVGALDLTGFAPTVQTPTTVTPGVGALELTGFAPTVSVGGGAATVTPGVGEVILEGFAPTISVGGGPPPVVGSVRESFMAGTHEKFVGIAHFEARKPKGRRIKRTVPPDEEAVLLYQMMEEFYD